MEIIFVVCGCKGLQHARQVARMLKMGHGYGLKTYGLS